MEIPQSFIDSLETEFQGRLRARWSGQQQAVVIEQRVARNIIPSLPRQVYSTERRQSLAEGYMPIMTVAVSEIMRCPDCSAKMEVPNRETRQFGCLACKLKGRNTKVIAGFYPLNSFLIHHLKEIDPLRNMDNDMVGKMQEHNERQAEYMQKQLQNDAEAYASDNLTKLMGIPTIGYAGSKVKEGTSIKGF